MPARDLMTGAPRSCRPDDAIARALDHMDECECGAVPVVDEDGKLVGIIAQADLATGIDDDAVVARYLREVSAAPAVEPAPER